MRTDSQGGRAGQALDSGLWLKRPGRLLLHDAGASLTNPASATSLLAVGAVANLWPTYAMLGDAVRVQAAGTYNMGTSSTLTWTVLQGSTAVATIGPSVAVGSGAHGWSLDLWFLYASSTSVIPLGTGCTRTASGGGFQTPSTASDIWFSDGTPVTVTAPPQTFDLKVIDSVSNASTTVACKGCQVRYYSAA